MKRAGSLTIHVVAEAAPPFAVFEGWGMTEAGVLEPTDDTFREYERVVDAKYLEQIRAEAREFSTKRLSRQSRLAECAIRSFKNGKNTIRPRSLRKLVRAIHDLQNKNVKN